MSEQPDFVERMEQVIAHIEQAQAIMARGPLLFYFKTLIEHSKALLTTFSPLQIGQLVKVAEAIPCNNAWNNPGTRHTLRIGATGHVQNVAYHDGQHYADFVPDVEYWNRHGDDTPIASRDKHSYHVKMKHLQPEAAGE